MSKNPRVANTHRQITATHVQRAKQESPEAVLVMPIEEGPGILGYIQRIPGHHIRATTHEGDQFLAYEGIVITASWEGGLVLQLVDEEGHAMRRDDEEDDGTGPVRHGIEATIPLVNLLIIEEY